MGHCLHMAGRFALAIEQRRRRDTHGLIQSRPINNNAEAHKNMSPEYTKRIYVSCVCGWDSGCMSGTAFSHFIRWYVVPALCKAVESQTRLISDYFKAQLYD